MSDARYRLICINTVRIHPHYRGFSTVAIYVATSAPSTKESDNVRSERSYSSFWLSRCLEALAGSVAVRYMAPAIMAMVGSASFSLSS